MTKRHQQQNDDGNHVNDAVHAERVHWHGEEEVVGERRHDAGRQRPDPSPRVRPRQARRADRSCRRRGPPARRHPQADQSGNSDHCSRAGISLRRHSRRAPGGTIDLIHPREMRSTGAFERLVDDATTTIHMESLWPGAHMAAWLQSSVPPPFSRTAPRSLTAPAADAALTLGALGVVFGDIGTSPLYALQATLDPRYHLGIERDRSLRHRQPDLLVVRVRRHGQICLHRHALRQSRGRRQPRALRPDPAAARARPPRNAGS